MEYLFPIPSDYEIVNNSLRFITIKTIILLENEFNHYKSIKKLSIKILNEKLIKYITKLRILWFLTILILFIFFFLCKLLFNSKYSYDLLII